MLWLYLSIYHCVWMSSYIAPFKGRLKDKWNMEMNQVNTVIFTNSNQVSKRENEIHKKKHEKVLNYIHVQSYCVFNIGFQFHVLLSIFVHLHIIFCFHFVICIWIFDWYFVFLLAVFYFTYYFLFFLLFPDVSDLWFYLISVSFPNLQKFCNYKKKMMFASLLSNKRMKYFSFWQALFSKRYKWIGSSTSRLDQIKIERVVFKS